MQCVRCQRHFEEDRDYWAHLNTQEHADNKDTKLDPEEESLLSKYS
jgi:uncharacterized C2H2 Zn-finger protein